VVFGPCPWVLCRFAGGAWNILPSLNIERRTLKIGTEFKFKIFFVRTTYHVRPARDSGTIARSRKLNSCTVALIIIKPAEILTESAPHPGLPLRTFHFLLLGTWKYSIVRLVILGHQCCLQLLSLKIASAGPSSGFYL
jgi:hypothetical protein